MSDFPLDELWRLPYVDAVPRDGRKVLLQVPFYDTSTGDWHLYFPTGNGQVGRMAGGEAVYGTYLARGPADPDRDVDSAISTLIVQHLSFAKPLRSLQRFENDSHNCAAVLEKYQLISASARGSRFAALLVVTELEYLLALIRAMYDLLNEIVKEVAPLLINLEGDRERVVKRQLPDSFADVALHGDRLLSGDQIVEKRQLPPALANWYVNEAPAFKVLRAVRDAVIHRGVSLPTVLDLEDRGLAVARDEHPWSEFAFWESVEPVNGRLVPLRLALASFVTHILGASERLASAIAGTIQLPPAIGSGIRVYLRSDVTRRLVELPRVLDSPWERDSTPASPHDGRTNF